MTRILLADEAAAADLAGYLARLLRHDRRASVRVRATGAVLATFGRPPFGDGGGGVVTLRTSALAEPADVDVTVSAGQLLDGLAPDAATLDVPAPLTGPTWAGVLPPRTGWEPVAEPDAAEMAGHVARAVAEFRARVAALPQERRVRAELDRLADDLWSRPVPGVPGGELPMRAAHAARSLGFLPAAPTASAPKPRAGTDRPGGPSAGGPAPGTTPGAETTPAPGTMPAPGAAPVGPVAGRARVLVAGSWIRLDAPFGSVFTRRAGAPRLLFAR